jgi:phosphotransferase system enzyme I (PtsP)
MGKEPEFGKGGEHVEVLETYRMFAYDEGWSRRINEAIDSGLTAEAAIERVQQRTRMRMREIDDPLLADRMHDLEDLSNRLLRIVSGQIGTAAGQGLRRDSVLVARNLGPAELLEYDRRRLKGVVLEEGSLTAHMVIVARAMGIPVVGRAKGLMRTVRKSSSMPITARSRCAPRRRCAKPSTCASPRRASGRPPMPSCATSNPSPAAARASRS